MLKRKVDVFIAGEALLAAKKNVGVYVGQRAQFVKGHRCFGAHWILIDVVADVIIIGPEQNFFRLRASPSPAQR
ncbi:hypothetical protein [Caballeronia zhejiangensis]|uniref:hypothetical protein n=1 Tax=Caballeronia zhejiangensis TaxID=871203 RepID=UPI001EF4B9C1|nr:hypothetical protein [Caballeronia zhejiangensis]MCG7400261.1 hypothetical protein [Caballeronia zhejiangensis]